MTYFWGEGLGGAIGAEMYFAFTHTQDSTKCGRAMQSAAQRGHRFASFFAVCIHFGQQTAAMITQRIQSINTVALLCTPISLPVLAFIHKGCKLKKSPAMASNKTCTHHRICGSSKKRLQF